MPVKTPVYMDYHATTPVDQRVLDAMIPYFTQTFGNAASRTHSYGWTAEKAVDKARAQIAKFIGAEKPEEIVFTSGATESDNLAIKGVAEFYKDKGNHIITTKVEHKAVLDTCKRLEKEGYEVTYLPVSQQGLVTAEQVREAITDKTILVSVMLANNEVGAIMPIREIGAVCREKGVLLHCDAVQGLGKTEFDVQSFNVDLVSITAHKIYGPKGVGALYVRRSKPRVRITPILDGGGHERGYRSGTLNVPGIVGFGAACEIYTNEWRAEADRLRGLRDRLKNKLFAELDELVINGPWPEPRLPNNLNVSFAYVEGEGLLMGVKELCVSSGSACTSASLEPSYVLRAMGVEEEMAHTSLRFGLGRFTTEEEIDFAANEVITAVKRLREMSPLYEMAKEGIDLKSIQWTAH